MNGRGHDRTADRLCHTLETWPCRAGGHPNGDGVAPVHGVHDKCPCTIAVAAQMPYPITAIQPERQQTFRLKRTETMAVLQWEGALYAAENAVMQAFLRRPAKHDHVWGA